MREMPPAAPVRLAVTGPPGSGASRVAAALLRAGVAAHGSWTSEGAAADARRLADASLAAEATELRVALDADDGACLRRWGRWGDSPRPTGDGAALGALRERRSRLGPARTRAQLVLDTSALELATVRRRALRLVAQVAGLGPGQAPLLVAESFAYRSGVPADIDWCIDTRCLRNPYWEPSLRALTGRDAAVRAYVLGQPAAGSLLAALGSALAVLRPEYAARGRPVLRVAFGCTGGRHRSVAMARAAARRWRRRGWPVLIWDRDCG